jgi:hypothetical protein
LIHVLSVVAAPLPQTGTIIDIQPREPPGQLQISWKQNGKPVNGKSVNAYVNMQVRRNDLLILAKGAKAIIACDGEAKPHSLTPNAQQSCPCRAPLRVESSNPEMMFPRSGPDTAASDFPVIILPRATLLLNNRPKLRWSAVPPSAIGNSTTETVYRVSINTDSGEPVWSQDGVRTNEMVYPSSQEPLAPGTYLLEVSTGTHSSNDEHWPGRGFTVLPTCSPDSLKGGAPLCLAQQVREEEMRIREMNLPDDSTRLLIAKLYANKGLYAEANEELEKVTETLRTPTVISQLGDLYSLISLNREAANLYQKALGLPAMSDDPRAQASTLYSLAQVYEALPNMERRVRATYDEAIRAYKKLGDRKMVMRLKHQRP